MWTVLYLFSYRTYICMDVDADRRVVLWFRCHMQYVVRDKDMDKDGRCGWWFVAGRVHSFGFSLSLSFYLSV